jgi:serine/threonine protein kinase
MPEKKSQLGKTYRAKFKGRDVFYRRMEFTRLSNYVMEELSKEIDDLPRHDCDYLVPILGVVIDLPSLGVVTPIMPNGSLYDALHVTKRPFSFQEKLKIMRDVARCMTQLHASGMCHGHLTSHNVMLSETWHGFVSDYGLAKVKKYAGVMLSYTNKSAWSSPEQLRERSITVMKVTTADDIYSFGVVLWEILTESIPFEGFSRKELGRKVALEHYKPQIPPSVPESLSDLMKSCWNTDPVNRPDFALVAQSLT